MRTFRSLSQHFPRRELAEPRLRHSDTSFEMVFEYARPLLHCTMALYALRREKCLPSTYTLYAASSSSCERRSPEAAAEFSAAKVAESLTRGSVRASTLEASSLLEVGPELDVPSFT